MSHLMCGAVQVCLTHKRAKTQKGRTDRSYFQQLLVGEGQDALEDDHVGPVHRFLSRGTNDKVFNLPENKAARACSLL